MSRQRGSDDRKLPPLPQSGFGAKNDLSFDRGLTGWKIQRESSIPTSKNGFMKNEQPPLMITNKMEYLNHVVYKTPENQPTRDKRQHLPQILQVKKKMTFPHRFPCQTDLTPEIVGKYLQEHPDFLEEHVMEHVPCEKIQKWCGTKCVHLMRKKTTPAKDVNGGSGINEFSTKGKSTVKEDKLEILENIIRKVDQNLCKEQLLTDLSLCCQAAIGADGFNIYLVNENTQELYLYKHNTQNVTSKVVSQCTYHIGRGSTVAAFVAHTNQSLCQSILKKDDRFPEGMGVLQNNAHSVLVHPICTFGSVFGVMELYRSHTQDPFMHFDESYTAYLLIWGEVTLYVIELYHSNLRQEKLNEFLLNVTKSIFQDIVSMDGVIMKIMNFAKKLVNADRTALFLADHKARELYASIFDMGDSSEELPLKKEIRFPMDKGVAGYVASQGEILNIKDAYSDERFNKNVDKQTGYTTKTILCMPIYIRGNIIGVVQMVNKLEGFFTKDDEKAFETFAVYCGLALHHAKLYEKSRRSEQKHKVALEVLSYHAQPPDDEVHNLMTKELPAEIPDITNYDFSPWAISDADKPLHSIFMLRKLFGLQRIDFESLVRFTLTVRKSYRPVPYHNWAHAFSVAHAMYTVLLTSETRFTWVEKISMYVACLCHDLDHRGKTNSFMVQSSTPLAGLYSTSTMEHHHFNQTVYILQQEDQNVFKYVTPDQYKEVLGDIKHCILSTDLALFFGNRAKLKELIENEEFSWDIKAHRQLVMAIAMTACDLCSMYKPWDIMHDLVLIIMEEFWIQGDNEKERGMTPMALMDRDKESELPQQQVGFLVGICIPCYETLAQILPGASPMVDGAQKNLRQWQKVVDEQNEKTT